MGRIDFLRMRLLGLTGGVGMGKSTCAQLLSVRGVPVVDTDALAREVVEPGQPALAEIRQRFGPEVIDSNGALRRDTLARRVFAHSEERKELESILHPRIRALWRARVDSWRSQATPVAAVAIPLLYETKAEAEFDSVICTACSPATQHARLQARGWPSEQIHQRILAQWPVEEKIAQANFVIWTEGPVEIHAAQLERILSRI